ncbi:EscU/YscU/HrcU family type III secretion system export apparatus switch protein [Granulicella arctica]|uniref:EscU/YscU/HrcU family type III secretion system export apparatus switch protein n=1 Tax=Granulicella arctica TaxID=940613 RepID=UPI0021DF8271|nr:EscU/YscU/HrcU family type III secretion system export apparatus switch protein [Granulicella arctica]
MSDKGTEQASPQRKQKAKDRGDVVRSRELLSAAAMLAGVLALGVTARSFVTTWGEVYAQSLHLAVAGQVSVESAWRDALRTMLAPALFPIFMVLVASFLAALSVGIAQGGGLSIHPNALELKFERLNPVTNLGNLFSLRAVTRVVKSLVPAAVMVVFGWGALKALMVPMPVMSLLRLPSAFSTAYGLALDAAWVTLAWSGLDYVIEWRSWNSRLMVTKQEMRQEMREAMGNPEIKGRIRQIQRAMRRRKIKADISRASVIITNPTHYAVALEFSFDTMQAPTVLAKGRDLHAADIREEAQWAGIPMIENPALARSLYKAVEPGQSIPYELYAAVAGILAFLYRQKMEEKMRSHRAREERAAAAATPAVHRGMYGFGGGI